MNFQNNVTYTETIEMFFGSITPLALAEVFRDGRAAARLMYAHLLSQFDNLSRNDAAQLGLRDVEGKIYQLKIMTSRGVNLLPAKCVGVGREYNREDYLTVLRSNAGFIFVDVTNMPHVTYTVVPTHLIPYKAKLSYNGAIELIEKAKTAQPSIESVCLSEESEEVEISKVLAEVRSISGAPILNFNTELAHHPNGVELKINRSVNMQPNDTLSISVTDL